MSKSLTSSFPVRASAGALCLLLIATGTGLIPVAGLSPDVPQPPPAAITPPTVPGPVDIGVKLPPTPAVKATGSASRSGVTLNASLSQGHLVRGDYGLRRSRIGVFFRATPLYLRQVPRRLGLSRRSHAETTHFAVGRNVHHVCSAGTFRSYFRPPIICRC